MMRKILPALAAVAVAGVAGAGIALAASPAPDPSVVTIPGPPIVKTVTPPPVVKTERVTVPGPTKTVTVTKTRTKYVKVRVPGPTKTVTVKPTPAEDDKDFDCRKHGNKTCGPGVVGNDKTGYTETFANGGAAGHPPKSVALAECKGEEDEAACIDAVNDIYAELAARASK